MEPQHRELSDEEKKLCIKVVQKWHKDKRLVFPRMPNYVTSATILLVAIGLIIIAFNSLKDTTPFYRSPLFLILLAIAILLPLYVLKELMRIREGNNIVLTESSFDENRTGIFGSKYWISIPWDQVVAATESSEQAGIIMGILGILFAPGENLKIYDKSHHKEYTYRSITVKHYNELRAAIITKVGLTEKQEIWRYE
ncbi:hypothetical protein ACFLTN_04585 [Chloroflexota bacterium]